MSYAINNVILVGSVEYPLYRFTNANIVLNSLSGVFSVDTVGNELSVDTFSLTVRYDPYNRNIYAPVSKNGYETPPGAVYALNTSAGRDYMTELPYGTAVYWYCDGEFFRKGYLQSVDRIGKYAWRLTVISGVGLLAESYHAGGLYARSSAGSIISDIIGGTLPCYVDEAVGTVIVNGWLPYDTRRNNLHRILFALGASLLRGDANTDYTIGFIHETPTPPEIPDSRIALGGKVSYILPATSAEVTEHTYFQTAGDQLDTLFDNTGSTETGRQTVIFGGPHYDLTVTGTLTVEESNVNYAVVSGQGVLTGKAYTHTTRVIAESSGAGGTPLVKRVTDNTLVSALNSQNVAKRVLAYFRTAKTVSAKLIQNDERCGVMYAFNDAFGEATRGFLQKMTFSPTSVKAAQCDFIEGYTPTGQGNFYNNRAVIDASGTWTVPDGVTRIRVVMIGGGDGGSGGYDGESGMGGNDLEIVPGSDFGAAMYPYPGQNTPAGGNAGVSGSPGKVLIFDVDVDAGEVLTAVIGVGGTGGASNGGIGTAGTDTTLVSAHITSCTTADGTIVQAYYDPITQEYFAATGEAGHAGGDGGLTVDIQPYTATSEDGFDGNSVGSYAGGVGGNGISGDPKTYDSRIGNAIPSGYVFFEAKGAGGGGAAYGAAGDAGGAGEWIVNPTQWYSENGLYGTVGDAARGGDGGDGADAIAPAKPLYGCGGGGGNGGGGGGNGGGCVYRQPDASAVGYYFRILRGSGGSGGSGSAGGDGGDGVIIIYY